jgi:hypothetical protein
VRHKAFAIACFSALMGILVAGALGYYLWHQHNWVPSVDLTHVQSLLVSIVQTQAGILAIALSFSLLYVQISVDAYSLRAAGLLVRQSTFKRMTGYYVLSLVLNGMLALFVGSEPEFLPLLAGAIGAALFVCGLTVLVAYIADMADCITPEAIIREVRRHLHHERIKGEALERAFAGEAPKHWGEDLEDFSITMILTSQAHVSDDLQVLIDIGKRMVSRPDHLAVGAVINGIVDLQHGDLLPQPLPLGSTAEERAARIREGRIARLAVLVYLADALVGIWMTAIRFQDQGTARRLVSAMGELLGHDVLLNFVARTNVLRAAVYELMFRDTSKLEWSYVRRRVIHLLTDRLYGIVNYHWKEPHPNAWGVYELLERIGYDLLREESLDEFGELEVFKGICEFGRYSAAVGDGAMVSEIGFYLKERASRQALNFQDMARLVERMGSSWVRGSPLVKYRDKPFWFLLTQGVVPVVVAYNEQRSGEPGSLPSGANYHYLDALEGIAVACIDSERWYCLEETLEQMNRLVREPEFTPGYAAFCLGEVLKSAVERAESKAIGIWAEAVASRFPGLYFHAKSERARTELERASSSLLGAVDKARASKAVASDPELEGKLTELAERLEQVHAEHRSGK